MTTERRVLIIDDDRAFCRAVAAFFARHGLACDTLTDPRLVLSQDLSGIALVLLDIGMPGLDGLALLPLLKARRDVPVMMVSGTADLDMKLTALRAGAEFHFTKPVALDELLLVAARRLSLGHAARPTRPWTLDLHRRSLTSPSGEEIGLSGTEARLMEAVIRAAPGEVPRAVLIAILTGMAGEDPRAARLLEVILSRLRTRFRAMGQTLPVKASRGVGYIFLGCGQVIP